jgi:hypothetical protein
MIQGRRGPDGLETALAFQEEGQAQFHAARDDLASKSWSKGIAMGREAGQEGGLG